MKVMLDTNILVSAFLFKSKVINKLIDKLSKEHKIIICSYTVEELNELIMTKFKVDVKELDEFLTNFPFEMVYSPKKVKEKLFEIRDENDYIILHTAIIKDVDIFITGDKFFFDVNIERPEIITVKDFFEKY